MMDNWIKPTVLICLYGLLKSVKPIEPFLTPFLTGPDKNLTAKELNDQVYPVWTYSYVILIILVFLLTDLLRHKVVIILEGFSYIATWAMLIWAKGLIAMQFMQFTYGIATATEIAYFAYIYAVVPQDKYKIVSGYVRAFLLVGKCLSSVIGQVLISTKTVDYLFLNYIAFADVAVACFLSFFLPSSKHSIYFHQGISDFNVQSYDNSSTTASKDTSRYFTESTESNSDNRWCTGTIDTSSLAHSCAEIDDQHMTESYGTDDYWTHQSSEFPTSSVCKRNNYRQLFIQAFTDLWKDFLSSYSNKKLLIWSIWWAFATCGDLQVLNYAQNLWKEVDVNRTNAKTYNGAVDAVSTFISASCAFSISHINANWEAYGELVLAFASLGNGALLFIMARTTNIWIAYSFYGLFRAIYQTVITIATFQIAKHLQVERYGLVFGFNTFLAVLLQTLITVIVVDKHGLDVDIRTQFMVNGAYFAAMGLVFFVSSIVRRRCCLSQTEEHKSLLDTQISAHKEQT